MQIQAVVKKYDILFIADEVFDYFFAHITIVFLETF